MQHPETDVSHEKTKFYPYRWVFLNNAALKEALVSRGLSTAGSRKAWCLRLSEYENEVKKVQGQSPSHEGPAIPPRLLKVHMKSGYHLASFMKQVIIRPFKRQLLKVPGVTAWLDESSTYVLKKTKSGNVAAYLKFDTIDKGDAAYFDLKEKLQDHGVEVSHPPFPQMRHADLKNVEDPLETFMTEDFIKEEFVQRLIVLENLPAELNVDEKLCEIFSTALATVSFEHEPSSQGIAILEMPSVDEVNRLMGDEMTVEVTIEDQKIYASKYTQRANQWSTAVKLNKTEFKKLDMSVDHMDVDSDNENMDTGTSAGKKDFSVVLSDNERLEMCRELSLIKEQMQSTANQTDIFGLEKIQRHTALIEKMQDIYKPMVMDAKRRLECNLPIPEPWHLVPQPIQAIINKGDSSHCLRLEDLEEKFLKAKKEMEAATSEAKKLANSILCVEKQLKGEEASKWEAKRPQLELEKVLENRQSRVGKKGATQAPEPVSEEKQYSVYDYGNSLSSVLSQLQDSATTEQANSHQDNSMAQDGPVRGQHTERTPKQIPKGGGKMRKRDNKGKQKQGPGVGKGYGNQGNKGSVVDDYGQFGRRHDEIQGPQQQGNHYDRKGGDFKDSRGKGRGKPGVGGNMWNTNSREQEIEEMGGNDWGKFISRNTDKKPGSKTSGKTKDGNQWPKAGLKPLGGEKSGGKDKNRDKGGSHQEQDTSVGNEWAQMVGQLFGEVTGGGAGTVVTAEVPVKKKKEDGQEVEEILETSQLQIKSKRNRTDTGVRPKSSVQSTAVPTTSPPTDASKKWMDDYNRLRQDILTGTEPANQKQGKAEKSPWAGHKFEPVGDKNNKGSSEKKAGIKFKWLSKDKEEKSQSGDSEVQQQPPGPTPPKPYSTDQGERNNRSDHRRSDSWSHDSDRRGGGLNSRRDSNRRDKNWRGGTRHQGNRGYYRDERDGGYGDTKVWGRDQRREEEDTYRKENPVETNAGMAQLQPSPGPQVQGNDAMTKLSAIEAVLNEKMRKLQELQMSSRQTEMQLLAAAGQTGANMGVGQNPMY